MANYSKTRSAPRFVTDIPLQATVLRAQGKVSLSGRCTLIGEGGLCCHLPIPNLHIGDLLAVELDVAGTPIQTVAEIRYHSPAGYYGVQFLGLSWDQRDTLIRYCRRLPVAPDREEVKPD